MRDIYVYTYHAHALPSGDQCRNANEPANGGEDAPAAAGAAERQQHGGDEAQRNRADAEAARKDDARPVAVADGPADEVRVRLSPQHVLNRRRYLAERRRVRRRADGAQHRRALARRQVELAPRALGQVCDNDAVDFLAERLDADCFFLFQIQLNQQRYIHLSVKIQTRIYGGWRKGYFVLERRTWLELDVGGFKRVGCPLRVAAAVARVTWAVPAEESCLVGEAVGVRRAGPRRRLHRRQVDARLLEHGQRVGTQLRLLAAAVGHRRRLVLAASRLSARPFRRQHALALGQLGEAAAVVAVPEEKLQILRRQLNVGKVV